MNTALIPITSKDSETRATTCIATLARADFVAQLIAMASGAPQTRIRRRAEPEEAIAAYEALSRPADVRSGDVLTRSL